MLSVICICAGNIYKRNIDDLTGMIKNDELIFIAILVNT